MACAEQEDDEVMPPSEETAHDSHSQQNCNSEVLNALHETNKKLDNILEIIKPEKENPESKKKQQQSQNDSDSLQEALKKIKFSDSMPDVLSNELVDGVFKVSKEQNLLICNACNEHDVTQVGIPVVD